MDNKICVGYLTNIRDMFVVGSERCEGEALEYQNKFINALNYAIEFIDNAPTVEERPQGDLISREALKKQVKELLDLAVKRVDDTPTNSPCYRMYVEQENERARLIEFIDNAPTVSPEKALINKLKGGNK